MSRPLTLTTAEVDWFSRHLGLSCPSDLLARIYDFAHEFNAHRCGETFFLFDIEPASFHWEVVFLLNDGEEVLRSPLARTIYVGAALVSSEEPGTLIYNDRFTLKDEYCRLRFGTTLYAAEVDLHRFVRAAEIHLDAKADGRSVWLKKFGFEPREPQLFWSLYRDWAARNNAPSAVATWSEIPDAFLCTIPKIELFRRVS